MKANVSHIARKLSEGKKRPMNPQEAQEGKKEIVLAGVWLFLPEIGVQWLSRASELFPVFPRSPLESVPQVDLEAWA